MSAGLGAGLGGTSGVNAGLGASLGGTSGLNAGLGAGVGGTTGVNAGLGASLGGLSGTAGATVGTQSGVGAGLGITLGSLGLGNLPGVGSMYDPAGSVAVPTTGTATTSRSRSPNTRTAVPVGAVVVSPETIDSLNAAPYDPYTDEARYVGSYDDDDYGAQNAFNNGESRSLIEQRKCRTRYCLRHVARAHR
ncbi:hypothetical protein P7D22_03390 [Lichenihabitans sp. Uapishka_5]|uniref:hypothetical protein n=1 Tax=Lichenihabitans sp. Uapishka_5 TaxID=3037302 RepID=UPI0029E7DED9|nr:hypothetical protein [Lichenihabitans sp. Uapishka_5]MDX7950222.1 hypothetical protein [Lichenihabitans sp. Uapishka_5]